MTSARRRAGLLVALEGIDGTGKSTLQRRMAARLRRDGWRVATWHEPVSAALGRRAAELGRTDPIGAAVGFTMDRLLGRPELGRRLARADLVLTDRSFYSTLAYQGSRLRAHERRALVALQRVATVPPDRVLWLDVPVATAVARIGRRGDPRAPLERKRNLDGVARAYRQYARGAGWVRLDARAEPNEVVETAVALVRRWLRARAGDRRRRRA